MSATGITSGADQALELKVRAKMLGVDPGKIPPASAIFDFSFVQKAAAELKGAGWKPSP